MMENHSLNSVYLKQEQIVRALESVTQIPVEEISEVQDLQLGTGGTEESILLCAMCSQEQIALWKEYS